MDSRRPRNGIAGFTNAALRQDRTIVIGRVGQFCGGVRVAEAPSWVTDNALMTSHIDPKIDLDFLALCLEGCQLNRSKIGNYLPLINQRVVHEAKIPLPELSVQRQVVSEIRERDRLADSILKHIETTRLLQSQLSAEFMK